VLLFLAVCSTAHAQLGLNQKRISETQWRRGFHGFNMIAEANELERITIREFQQLPSRDVLVIVMGKLTNLPISVTRHFNDGGSALIASDSSQSPNGATIAGFMFGNIRKYPTRGPDSFFEMQDCPIVRDFAPHPIVANVNALVTNRPGYILTIDSTVADLPAGFRGTSIVGASENRSGGRAVAVGDQSIFTNQMLIHGDNTLFANDTIKWLKHDRCRKLLVLVDGTEYPMLDPTDVVVNVPPPSQEEVMDALKDIPPSAVLDFANSVATVVEDENMVNEFIHDSVDKIPKSAFNRFYIYLLFGIACLSFIAAFLFQRKLQSHTASEVAFRRSRGQQVDLKAVQFVERQQAARFLLDKFCFDMDNRQFGDWPNFPAGLVAADDSESKNVFESMTKMSVLYRSKPTKFWTRKKLASLEKEVNHWRSHFESRPETSKQTVT
jgi:hypothetical protein